MSARSLGVELGREVGLGFMPYAFVGIVVHVDEEWAPIVGQRSVVDGKTVVLRGDEAPVGPYLPYRLVVAAMSVFQFVYLSASGSR